MAIRRTDVATHSILRAASSASLSAYAGFRARRPCWRTTHSASKATHRDLCRAHRPVRPMHSSSMLSDF